MTRAGDASGVPPDQVLMHLLTGMWTTQAIGVAARLRVPDILHGGAATAEAVAEEVGAEPRAMRRLLRALASVGVFAAVPPDLFTTTPLSDRLRDAPGTLRNMFIAETDDVHWRSWLRLGDAVRTGAPQPLATTGMSVFDYYNHHREDGEQFGRAMQDVSAMVARGVLENYDFSPFKTIVDVGGGNGTLLISILQKHPGAAGLLIDLSYMGPQAHRNINDASLGDRCRFEAGDFFKAVPAGDLYVLKFILHDWDDEDCVRILEQCRRAANPGGHVLVIEMLVPDDNSSPMVGFMDLNMLVMTGGLERTSGEYHGLMNRAGLRPTRISPTGTPFFLIEAAV
jgi:SAM-dependent methyltransferase